MKYFFTILLTLSLFKVNAARVTPTQFLEIASKQSMLSQKIAKNYMLLTYDDTNQKSLLDLKISMSYFNRNLETLRKYALGNEKLSSAIEVQKTTWNDYSVALKKEKTAENAVKVLKLSEVVFKSSNYVLAIGSKDYRKTKSNVDLGTLINITIKQSALTQRLCLLFLNQKLQDQLDKKSKMGSESLLQVFNQMDESLGYIISSPLNAKANAEELVGQSSLAFDKLKERKKNLLAGKLEIVDVMKITNSLAKLYNELSSTYIRLK